MDFTEIKKQLGEPYYEIENKCLIFKMDCIKGLSKIEKEVFDLTITSPPYNIGKEYEKNLEISDYINWCQKWINLIYEKTKKNGAFDLNVGYIDIPGTGSIPIPYLLWDKLNFFMMQEIIWHYGAGVACKKKLSPRNEKILWGVKNNNDYTFNLDEIRDPDVKYPNQKKNGKLRCNPLGKNPGDVWIIPKVTSGKKRSSKERAPHPAQFPMELIKRLMLAHSNKGDLILDTFMGSGTTAEVALLNGRKVIGFEIDDKYCEYIKQRLSQYDSVLI